MVFLQRHTLSCVIVEFPASVQRVSPLRYIKMILCGCPVFVVFPVLYSIAFQNASFSSA